MTKDFKLLLSGQLVSQVGDKCHMIALAFWVLETTGSTGKMGAVLAASLIPSLVLGLFSGAVIDRYSRKAIIVGTDVIRGLVLLIFAWMMAAGQVNFTVVLVLQVILSVNGAFFDPSIPAVIPGIVGKEDLARANAMHQSVASFAMIGGAALGGVAVAGLGYSLVFLLNGISFLASAGFESFIRIPNQRDAGSGNSLVADIREGYAYLFGNQKLLVVLLMVMAIHFFVGGLEVFMPVIANHSGGPGVLGVFQAGLGGGILVMSLLLSRFSVAGKEETTLFTSVMAMGILQMLAFLLPEEGVVSTLGFTICFFLWGCAMVRAAVSFKTLLQTFAGETYGGRVFAVASTVGNGSIPAAMIVFGLALEYIGAGILLPVSGLFLTGLGLAALIMIRRRPV
ncbi:MAG TPA: hypothetical protein DHV36_04685 [Desulfobacteraceae bacterium]|nr:hypothetical protein [Desulfobacteraceae bacterium]